MLRSITDSLVNLFSVFFIVIVVSAACGLCVSAQDNSPKKPKDAPPIEEFEKYLSNSVMTGVFTIDGRPLNKLEEERYEIESAKKAEGDNSTWIITARIKYGRKDMKVPVPVNIEWTGRTPMIVLDNLTIPGLGTFSARVVFHDKKYAGTWKHDNIGGHLFGNIQTQEEIAAKQDSDKKESAEKKDDAGK